jgi:hypothetical protein
MVIHHVVHQIVHQIFSGGEGPGVDAVARAAKRKPGIYD